MQNQVTARLTWRFNCRKMLFLAGWEGMYKNHSCPLTVIKHKLHWSTGGECGQSMTHEEQITPVKTYRKGNARGCCYTALGPAKASKKSLWHQWNAIPGNTETFPTLIQYKPVHSQSRDVKNPTTPKYKNKAYTVNTHTQTRWSQLTAQKTDCSV